MTHKRLLFLSCWNPTTNNPNNGIFIRRHAEALRTAGAVVDFLAINIRYGNKLFAAKFTEGKNESSFDIESFAWKFIYTGYPLIRWIVKRYLIKHLMNRAYDIVVSNVAHPTALIGQQLSKLFHAPHAIIEHFSKTEFHLNHPLFGQSLKRIYTESSVVIPVSNFLRQTIQKHASAANCKVVPNVIDTKIFRHQSKKQDGPIKFVAVAHWHQTKRQVKRPDLIIDSLSQLKSKYADLEIEFIGDGNMVDDMRSKCKKHKLNAKFSGSQDAVYISQKLNTASYFVHASMIETFSVVVVESLSCGTPVIASNVGAIPDLITTDNGVLTNNSVSEWTKALERAINTSYDHSAIAASTQNKYDYVSIGQQLLTALDG